MKVGRHDQEDMAMHNDLGTIQLAVASHPLMPLLRVECPGHKHPKNGKGGSWEIVHCGKHDCFCEEGRSWIAVTDLAALFRALVESGLAYCLAGDGRMGGHAAWVGSETAPCALPEGANTDPDVAAWIALLYDLMSRPDNDKEWLEEAQRLLNC